MKWIGVCGESVCLRHLWQSDYLFRSSLEKADQTWLPPEEVKFDVEWYFRCVNKYKHNNIKYALGDAVRATYLLTYK